MKAGFKNRKGLAIGIFIVIVAVLFVAIRYFVMPMADFLGVTSKVTVIEDSSSYSECIGEEGSQEYRKSRDGLYEVFPDSLDEANEVEEFKHVYYNPWDPQYVSYMTIQYGDDSYEKELSRLTDLGLASYQGIYSVTGQPEGYKLVALKTDSISGFAYAMIPESPDQTITYVGIEFCNGHLDLDLKDYLPEKYMLVGFDASEGNPYMNK